MTRRRHQRTPSPKPEQPTVAANASAQAALNTAYLAASIAVGTMAVLWYCGYFNTISTETLKTNEATKEAFTKLAERYTERSITLMAHREVATCVDIELKTAMPLAITASVRATAPIPDCNQHIQVLSTFVLSRVPPISSWDDKVVAAGYLIAGTAVLAAILKTVEYRDRMAGSNPQANITERDYSSSSSSDDSDFEFTTDTSSGNDSGTESPRARRR